MDVLTDILDALELEGSLYYLTEFTAPWGLEVPADTNVCRFHVVTSGHGWIGVPETGDSALLSQGDVVLVPHGARHLLKDQPDTGTRELDQALTEIGYDGEGVFRWGEGGSVTRLVCGYFHFDQETVHPLLDSLPPLIHVQATPSYDFAWIEHLLRFLGREASSEKPGSSAIVRRLSEILFIQALRYYVDHAEGAVPLLSGIADPHVGRALRAMHRAPGRQWTLDRLAREAAQSRTAFARRFSDLVGATPIRYLTEVRMRRARELLGGPLSTAAVAERVGYRSEAAFHRRFKEVCGVAPGAYRRRLAAPRVSG